MRTFLLAAVCALSLASCTSGRAVPEPAAEQLSTSVALDSLAGLPPYLVPAPAGSSARQKRQWQAAQTANLARAGIQPTTVKIKHSAVATGAGSTAITKPEASVAAGPGAVATTVTKPKGPVATAPNSSATDNTKAGQRGGAAATGAGSSATATTEKGLSAWWLLAVVALVLLIVNKLVRGRWLL